MHNQGRVQRTNGEGHTEVQNSGIKNRPWPKQLFSVHCYPHTHVSLFQDPKPIVYHRSDVLTMPMRRKFERIDMDPKLAESLMPVEVRTGVALTTLNAELVTKDNQYMLKVCSTVSSVLTNANLMPHIHLYYSIAVCTDSLVTL